MAQAKIERYENFVDKRLKPDLVHAISLRPDASHIYVDIGLGFHVEFTLEEALHFIETKQRLLTKEIEGHSRSVANVKAHIKLVLEGIRELMETPENR